jgi:hypothetical protein
VLLMAKPKNPTLAQTVTTTKARRTSKKYQFDVCLSFAGEDRRYVERVANELREMGVRVFYDRYQEVELWGKDLYSHLNDVYSNAARYCVLFISANYATKVWTNHERSAAQDRAIRENREYILPVRFDKTIVPGLRSTTGYVNLEGIKPRELAEMIGKKVGTRQRQEFLPPTPDLLFRTYLDEFGEADLEEVFDSATHFLDALRRTNPEEREAIIQLFMNGCPAGLPENMHINADLLARLTGLNEGRLVRLFAGLRSLGFYSRSFKRGKDRHHIGEDKIISVEWHDLSMDSGIDGNATSVAYQMMNVKDFAHCDDCALATLRRLDFSHLSTSTIAGEVYDETGKRINLGRELRKLHGLDGLVSQKRAPEDHSKTTKSKAKKTRLS